MTEHLPIISLESHDKKTQSRILYMNKMNTDKLKLQNFIFMELCTLLREAVYFLILHLKVLKIQFKNYIVGFKAFKLLQVLQWKNDSAKKESKEKKYYTIKSMLICLPHHESHHSSKLKRKFESFERAKRRWCLQQSYTKNDLMTYYSSEK